MRYHFVLPAFLLLRVVSTVEFNSTIPECSQICNRKCTNEDSRQQCQCEHTIAKACAEHCDGPEPGDVRRCGQSHPMIPVDPPKSQEPVQGTPPPPSTSPEACECSKTGCLAARSQIGWCKCVNAAIDQCAKKCPGKRLQSKMRCCDGCIVPRDPQRSASGLSSLFSSSLSSSSLSSSSLSSSSLSSSSSSSLGSLGSLSSSGSLGSSVSLSSLSDLDYVVGLRSSSSASNLLSSPYYSSSRTTKYNNLAVDDSLIRRDMRKRDNQERSTARAAQNFQTTGGYVSLSAAESPSTPPKSCSDRSPCPLKQLCHKGQCVGADCFLHTPNESQKKRCPRYQICVQASGSGAMGTHGMCAIENDTCNSKRDCPSGWMCQKTANADGPLCNGRPGCGVCQHCANIDPEKPACR